jgi:polyhydroxyalkanoate synthesis regulator phasin
MSPHQRIDFVPTDELTKHGITKIYSNGKLLVLVLDDGEVRCKLNWNDLITTTEKYLSVALDKVGFESHDKDIICSQVMDILVNSVNEQIDKVKKEEELKQKEKKSILDEINHLREQNPDLTFEEWQSKLKIKFDNLRSTVKRLMPEIWPGLEFELSVSKVLNIEDCTLPVIGIILGRPSSSKSVIIDLMRKWVHVYCTDDFTPASFVTHTTATDSPEALGKIDMLPRMKNKLFLTPELSPMFSKDEKDLAHQLGIITKVADGKGYSSNSGAHGHRGYDEDIMFTWIGAAVDIPYKVFKILHTMGPRLYLFRMNFDNKSEDELLQKLQASQRFNERFKEIQIALFDYLKWFEIGPNLARAYDQSLGKMKWIPEDNENKDVMLYIVRLGTLLSHLRCVAQTFLTVDTQGTDYAYTVSQTEDPTRANTILYNIARGHALLTGRNHITRDDLSIVIHTTMSTTQIERFSIFSLLVANNGNLDTHMVLKSLNVSRPTALRTMTEFKAIGLVDMDDEQNGEGRPSKRIILKPEFDWLLTDEIIKKKVLHTPISFEDNGNGNGNGRGKVLAWPLYIEMEQSEQLNPLNFSQADKNTINRQEFHDKLMEKGQLSREEADKIIDDLIKEGKLEQPLIGTLRRIEYH